MLKEEPYIWSDMSIIEVKELVVVPVGEVSKRDIPKGRAFKNLTIFVILPKRMDFSEVPGGLRSIGPTPWGELKKANRL